MAAPRTVDPKGKAPGRPFTVRLTPQQVERLTREAERQGVTLSDLVRRALDSALSRSKAGKAA